MLCKAVKESEQVEGLRISLVILMPSRGYMRIAANLMQASQAC